MKKYNLFLIFIILPTTFSCRESGNDGVSPDPVVTSPYRDPVWHPSGEIIGFNHTPVKEIRYNKSIQVHWVYDLDSAGFWLINADGTNQRRVLSFTLITPAWSPDGEWIAFSQGAQLFKMPFDGTQFDITAIEQLTFEGQNFFPAWSPNGEWIVYDSDMDSPTGLKFVWKMRNNGLSKKRIVFTPDTGETRMPFWGNDFSILFQGFSGNLSQEIFKTDSAGNNKIQLTDNKIQEMFPQYSPNNKNITYISYSGGLSLNKMDISVNKTVNLTNYCENYSWSPNSEKIVYVNFCYKYIDKIVGNLWIMDADGENKQPLTYNNNIRIINDN